jgi:hypothetical protein
MTFQAAKGRKRLNFTGLTFSKKTACYRRDTVKLEP